MSSKDSNPEVELEPLSSGVVKAVALTCAILLLDVMLFGAIVPLLPQLRDSLSLSETQVGILTSSYAVGTVSVGLLQLFGVIRLAGKASMQFGLVVVALSSILVGLADSYELIVLGRFIEGAGGACCWAGGLAWVSQIAPPTRRGNLMGLVGSASAAGFVSGPLIGALAVGLGRDVVFCGVAALGLAFSGVVAALGERLPSGVQIAPTAQELAQNAATGWEKQRARRAIVVSLVMIGFFGLVGGVNSLLGSLQLDNTGASAGTIATCFAAGALIGAAIGPLVGIWSDKRGRLEPGLVAASILILTFAFVGFGSGVFIVAAGVTVTCVAQELLFAPAAAMIADDASPAGYDITRVFALDNLAWSSGSGLGGFGAGALSDAAGAPGPTIAMIVVSCLVIAALLRHRRFLGQRPSD